MSATLKIDDQLYRDAERVAREHSLGVEEFVADVLRRAIGGSAVLGERNGLPVFKVDDRVPPITSDDVRRAMEDEP